ncbi:UTRA domain-containing protein [Promicromonospora aerolata]|uniref:UTRA domain-containing protein n=1 Tax=Promicromonospora aerolata TaxID=195749 RepID=A0ABW4VCY3_9MICO
MCGWYARSSSRSPPTCHLETDSLRPARCRHGHAAADVALALRLPDDGTAVRRRRILLHNSAPVEVSTSYYPADPVAGAPLAHRSKVPKSAPAVLLRLGMPERRFIDRVSARQPTGEEIVLLTLPGGLPVLRQLRTILADDDHPVEVSVLIQGAHPYELQYRQDVPKGLGP